MVPVVKDQGKGNNQIFEHQIDPGELWVSDFKFPQNLDQ